MGACCRVRQDIGGGIVMGQLSKTVIVNNQPIAVQGDIIQDHGGPRPGPHKHPTIAQGSPTVFADGHPVARLHDHVTCGCTMTSGSPDVSIG